VTASAETRPVWGDDAVDPKTLYRLFEQLVAEGGRRSELAGREAVVAFCRALLDEHGATFGLDGLAVYEERREALRRVHGAGALESAPDVLTREERGWLARVTDDQPTWVGDGPPGRAALGASPGGLLGACRVADGLLRYVCLLSATSDRGPADVDVVLHALRSVLGSRLQQARWGSTMREAAAIQSSLLPARVPDFPGFEMAGISLPAEEVGGDFFDLTCGWDGAMCLAIGDASGHGLPAALVARDVVVGLRMGMDRDMRIAPVLERLNRIIHRGGPSSSFVSLFYGELEQNGNLFYVNAGHKTPLHCRVGPDGEPGFVRYARRDIVLGPVPDAHFKRHFVHVDRGDVLVLHTDGLNERQDGNGEMFGDERLRETLIRHRDLPVRELAEALLGEVREHGEGEPWRDDATVLVLRRLP